MRRRRRTPEPPRLVLGQHRIQVDANDEFWAEIVRPALWDGSPAWSPVGRGAHETREAAQQAIDEDLEREARFARSRHRRTV